MKRITKNEEKKTNIGLKANLANYNSMNKILLVFKSELINKEFFSKFCIWLMSINDELLEQKKYLWATKGIIEICKNTAEAEVFVF